MKKILISALCLIMLLCTACTSLNEDEEKVIKEDVYSIYEKLRNDWNKATDIKVIRKSLTKWAIENEISYSKLSDQNLLMSLDATDDYLKAPSTIIQCDIGTDEISSRAQCAAIAMTALKNSKYHGSVKLLFTASDNNEHYGAKALTKKQLKADNFISLDHCTKTKLFTGSAASRDYLLTQKIKRVKTKGNTAYKISFRGLEGNDSSDRTRKHGNPIKALGDLMNSCQSSGMAFQVSSLKGGGNIDNYPSYAEMIVTVDKNDENKLIKKFESTEEDFEESYRDKENDLKISCTKHKVPKSAYSETCTANIMSFLYTVDDGVFATSEPDDEGDPVAISTIGYIKENGKNVEMGIKARSIDPNQFKTMLDSFKSTAELSDFTVKETASYPYWPFKETSELTDSYMIAAQSVDLDFEPEWTFAENECALFYGKRQALDMICIGSNIQSGPELSESLVLYLQSLNGEQ